MAYILDLINGTIEQKPNRITLERFLQENAYITKYLSRVVKDQALVVYHVLFHLSWFQSGNGSVVAPWAEIGSYIMSTHGNIIHNTGTIRKRLPDLLQKKCISVVRQRGDANEILVHLPSEIPACRELIALEEAGEAEPMQPDERDYYTDRERRLEILQRDNHRCVYCTIEISEDTYVLDHLIPVSNGGTNRKSNLVASCQPCNQRKQDRDAIEFLLENYRNHLLSQQEYMQQKSYVEALLTEAKENG